MDAVRETGLLTFFVMIKVITMETKAGLLNPVN